MSVSTGYLWKLRAAAIVLRADQEFPHKTGLAAWLDNAASADYEDALALELARAVLGERPQTAADEKLNAQPEPQQPAARGGLPGTGGVGRRGHGVRLGR